MVDVRGASPNGPVKYETVRNSVTFSVLGPKPYPSTNGVNLVWKSRLLHDKFNPQRCKIQSNVM